MEPNCPKCGNNLFTIGHITIAGTSHPVIACSKCGGIIGVLPGGDSGIEETGKPIQEQLDRIETAIMNLDKTVI